MVSVDDVGDVDVGAEREGAVQWTKIDRWLDAGDGFCGRGLEKGD